MNYEGFMCSMWLFLCVQITKHIKWSKHTRTVVKKARQCSFSLSRLKRFGMGPQILERCYSCTTESILTGCITAWYGNSTALDRMALQRVVRTAQYITGTEPPAIQDLYIRRCEKKAQKSSKTPTSQAIDYFLCGAQQEVPVHQVWHQPAFEHLLTPSNTTDKQLNKIATRTEFTLYLYWPFISVFALLPSPLIPIHIYL